MRAIRILVLTLALLAGRLPAGEDVPAVPAEMIPRVNEALELFYGGDYAGAETIFRGLLGFEQDNVYLLGRLGVTLTWEEKYVEAEEILKKAVAAGPQDMFSLDALGCVYGKEKKFDEAGAVLKRAVEIDPDDVDAHFYLGWIAGQCKQLETAKKEMETVLALDPQHALATYGLALFHTYNRPSDKAKALESYQRALAVGMERNESLEEEIANLEETRPEDPLPPAVVAAQALFDKGFDTGDFSAAEQAFRELLKASPEDADLLARLGMTLFKENKCDEAEVLLKKSVALVPWDNFAQRALGCVECALDKYEEAETAFIHAFALDETDATAHNYLGIVEERQGKWEKARKEIETAIALDPQSSEGIFNMAVFYANNSSPDKTRATEYYKRALAMGARKNKSLEETIAKLEDGQADDGPGRQLAEAMKQFEAGDAVAAEKTLRHALESAPEDLYLLANLGVALVWQNKFEEAEVVLRKAVAIGPADAFALGTLGMVYNNEQKFVEAEKALSGAVELNPKDALLHDYLGMTSFSLLQTDRAHLEFETAIELDPKAADAVYRLAMLFAEEMPPDNAKAGEYYKRALALGGPRDEQLDEIIGRRDDSGAGSRATAKKQFESGDYAAAERTYRELLKAAPEDLYLLTNFGVTLFREGQHEEAAKVLKKAVAVAPGDGFANCTLGIVHYTQGKYAEAEKALNKAIEIDRKNATAHNYLGITMSQKGRQDVAQMELEKAVELDPKYADAHFNLAVVLATKLPADEDKAREHYREAVELGAPPDTVLDQLVKMSNAVMAKESKSTETPSKAGR